jgi:hypothetical protein
VAVHGVHARLLPASTGGMAMADAAPLHPNDARERPRAGEVREARAP